MLCRTSRDGVAKHAGFLDDFACMGQAMFELGGDGPELGGWLAREMAERFGDPAAGGFYFTDKSATDLIVRQKTATDSPLPSGNAVAAMALLSLGRAEPARAVLAVFAQQLAQNGEGMSSMVQAALLYLRQGGEPFTVSAGPEGGGAAAAGARPPTPQESAERVVAWATSAGPRRPSCGSA